MKNWITDSDSTPKNKSKKVQFNNRYEKVRALIETLIFQNDLISLTSLKISFKTYNSFFCYG